MEERERNHIRKHLPALLQNTQANIGLLTRLVAQKILNNNDLEQINAKDTESDKVYVLYEVLQTRVKAYKGLLQALLETNQTGAHAILSNLELSNSCSNIVCKRGRFSPAWRNFLRIIYSSGTLTMFVILVVLHIKLIKYHINGNPVEISTLAPPQSIVYEDQKNGRGVTITDPYTIWTPTMRTTTTAITLPTARTSQVNIFHSFQEYAGTQRMLDRPLERVFIQPFAASEWPKNTDMISFRSLEISHLILDGALELETLINILNQTSYIKFLHLKNSHNLLCGTNQGQLGRLSEMKREIHLPYLVRIVIEEFSDCVEIIELLRTCLNPLSEELIVEWDNVPLNSQIRFYCKNLQNWLTAS